MSTVKIDNLTIGTGRPKIIVPLVGKTKSEVLEEAKEARELGSDFVEWRIDHFKEVLEKDVVAELTKTVKEVAEQPLLITFRSYREGGVLDISDEEYLKLYRNIIEGGTIDLLDVELFMPHEKADEIIRFAHEKEIKVILCNHDFDSTPSQDEIVSRLVQMSERQADICKIAVMPKTVEDVFTLLNATREAHKKVGQPLITMSMGEVGKISRVCGELIGSSATFGSVGEGSAPGQIPVETLNTALDALKIEEKK